MSLRYQLVVGLVGVLTVVFLIIGVATTVGLRSWLVSRIDIQLQSARQSLAALPIDPGAPGNFPPRDNPLEPLANSGGLVVLIGFGQVRVKAGQFYADELTEADIQVLSTVPSGFDFKPVSVTLPGLGQFRVIAQPTVGGYTAVMAVSMASVNTIITSLAGVEIAVLGIALVGLGVLGWYLVGVSLRPLRRVSETAAAVAVIPLDRGDVAIPARVPVSYPKTEVGQVGAAVNSMLDHIEDSLQTRSATEERLRRFVSDAGHELRTPLAAVRGYSELIRRSAQEHPEQTLDSARRIELAATRMGLLVDDLLLLAAIDEGRPMRQERVELRQVVSDSVAEAYVVAPDAEWIVDQPETPLVVTGDPIRLHQAITNLLSNAISYAGATATIRITVRVDGAWIGIVVHDDGPGFPTELIPTATERFTRGEASRSRQTGGAGLGLAIVRAIIEVHEGIVTLGNDHGAWVCLYLPAEPAQPAGG